MTARKALAQLAPALFPGQGANRSRHQAPAWVTAWHPPTQPPQTQDPQARATLLEGRSSSPQKTPALPPGPPRGAPRRRPQLPPSQMLTSAVAPARAVTSARAVRALAAQMCPRPPRIATAQAVAVGVPAVAQPVMAAAAVPSAVVVTVVIVTATAREMAARPLLCP